MVAQVLDGKGRFGSNEENVVFEVFHRQDNYLASIFPPVVVAIVGTAIA